MFYSYEKSISRKNLLLYYPEKVECYNALISNLSSSICQVVIYMYGKLKTKKKFLKLKAPKVVPVAYESYWSLTRGSKKSDLTGKLLVLWKTGR